MNSSPASAIAFLNVGGHMTWQSALGRNATAIAFLTVGGLARDAVRLSALLAALLAALGSAATQSHAQEQGWLELLLNGLGQLGLLLFLLNPIGPRLGLVDAKSSTHHLLPIVGLRVVEHGLARHHYWFCAVRRGATAVGGEWHVQRVGVIHAPREQRRW